MAVLSQAGTAMPAVLAVMAWNGERSLVTCKYRYIAVLAGGDALRCCRT